MDEKKKRPPPKTIRWSDAEWAWLAEIARSVGLSRSSFIRTAVFSLAREMTARNSSYSVGVAKATPQNMITTGFGAIDRQIDGTESGGDRSRTRSEPEALVGQLSEKVGREGGASPTNEAKLARKAKASRS